MLTSLSTCISIFSWLSKVPFWVGSSGEEISSSLNLKVLLFSGEFEEWETVWRGKGGHLYHR